MTEFAINMLSGIAIALVLIMPLSYKWQLKKATAFLGACIFGAVSGVMVFGIGRYAGLNIVASVALEGPLSLAMALAAASFMFYRDPDRAPEPDRGSIVSPADGEVLYVKRIDEGQVPLSVKKGRTFHLEELLQTDILNGSSYLIGIGMNLLNVHVNRSPITGTVKMLKPITGSFLSLKIDDAVLKNERFTTVIDNESYQVGVVQIASRLVRRIETYLSEGQGVEKGERIGMIKFGSQVDVALPQLHGLEVTVSPGDELKAGESVIARLREVQKQEHNNDLSIRLESSI